MKFLFFFFFCLTSFQAFSQENAIRFNVGSLASGLSYTKENLDFKSGSEKQDTESYHITAGYLRHVGHNVQLVGNLSYEYSNTESGDTESEVNETVLELGALYNFNKEIKSSFYAGVLYYSSKRFQGDYDSTADTEVDGSVNGIELTIGKRFSLIENLSYVVSVDYITGLMFDGDYDDTYDGGSIVRVNLLTLEYYF